MLSFGWFCVLWVVITIAICIFLSIKSDVDLGVSFFVLSLFGVGMALMACSASYDWSEKDRTEKIISSTENVLSLKDGSNNEVNGSIRGNFLFTYGQVNSNENTYYRIIAGNNTDGFQMKDLSITETKLFFIEDNESPKLTTDTQHIEYKKDKNWLIGGIIKVEDETYKKDELLVYKLYIPKSAVKVEFNVDME